MHLRLSSVERAAVEAFVAMNQDSDLSVPEAVRRLMRETLSSLGLLKHREPRELK